MIKRICMLAFVMLMAAGLTLPAGADTITTLYGTGLDNSGNLLPWGTLGDPHYKLVSVPSGSSTQIVVGQLWGSGSSWQPNIGPHNPGCSTGCGPTGYYDYQTTFDLSGMNPATASITGQWTTDNYGRDILLNGHSTGNTTGNNSFDWEWWTPFSIPKGSDFKSGLNTLDFIVYEPDANWTGLGVKITSTIADPAPDPVPEPATLLLLCMGLAALAAWRMRSRKAQTVKYTI